MKVNKIHHVSIMVWDLEKARKIYSDLFGIEFEGPFEQKDLDVRFVSSKIGLNIASPLTPDGPAARTLEKRGEGLCMLIFNVSNLDKSINHMDSHKIRMVARADRSTSRVASFHPKDLHGVMVELMEE